MRPNSSNRRIAPAGSSYQRRNRRLLILVPVAFFTLFSGASLWWFAEDMGLSLPGWHTARSTPELSLGAEEREALQTQLDMLRTQWQRLDSLDALQRKPAPPQSAMLRLALQLPSGLGDSELRDRVDILSKALDERLFAPAATERKSGSGRLMPVTGVTPSSNFGLRLDPFSGRAAMHNGIDFVAPIGTPVYAADAGVVKSAGLTPQFGWTVELDHGRGVTTRYAHAYRLWVRPGQPVAEGQKIAEVGSTGKSTGPHLHFEVRYNGAPLNPMRYLALK
ncbi:MAG: M23 family metallopeptidase [Chitinivorax sp.]